VPNLLNLPAKISFSGMNNAGNEYVYSISGTKLAVIHRNGASTHRTDYVGNMIYKNDSILDMILVDGGYIKDGQYHFFLQDHLGSNRVVADADGGGFVRDSAIRLERLRSGLNDSHGFKVIIMV
jgi:hypothetical protein